MTWLEKIMDPGKTAIQLRIEGRRLTQLRPAQMREIAWLLILRIATVRAIRPLFLIILAVDTAMLAFHVYFSYRYAMHLDVSEMFDLSTEGGYGEYWEYLLTSSATLVMVHLALTSRDRFCMVAAGVLGWLTFDNMLGFHEGGGQLLSAHFGPGGLLGIETQELGEMLVYASVGVALSLGLIWSLADPLTDASVIALTVTGFSASAAVFGVGVDLLNSLATWGHLVIGFVEDGGELVLMSIASAITLASPSLLARQTAGV